MALWVKMLWEERLLRDGLWNLRPWVAEIRAMGGAVGSEAVGKGTVGGGAVGGGALGSETVGNGCCGQRVLWVVLLWAAGTVGGGCCGTVGAVGGGCCAGRNSGGSPTPTTPNCYQTM